MKRFVTILGFVVMILTLAGVSRNASAQQLPQIKSILIGEDKLSSLIDGKESIYLFAANGDMNTKDAMKMAAPIAQSVCKLNGGSDVKNFYLKNPVRIYPQSVYPQSSNDISHYLVIKGDKIAIEKLGPWKTTIFNNPIDAFFTSIFAYKKDVVEAHYLSAYGFTSIECLAF